MSISLWVFCSLVCLTMFSLPCSLTNSLLTGLFRFRIKGDLLAMFCPQLTVGKCSFVRQFSSDSYEVIFVQNRGKLWFSRKLKRLECVDKLIRLQSWIIFFYTPYRVTLTLTKFANKHRHLEYECGVFSPKISARHASSSNWGGRRGGHVVTISWVTYAHITDG